jgi:hypothetical protein
VIAHEYFHNWTGDRVTCRDWFQLTLKEGLTMYRDSRYTADMTAASTKRINDVIGLRNSQFLEDAGGTAHPIRPESYISMSNFYTATVRLRPLPLPLPLPYCQHSLGYSLHTIDLAARRLVCPAACCL